MNLFKLYKLNKQIRDAELRQEAVLAYGIAELEKGQAWLDNYKKEKNL